MAATVADAVPGAGAAVRVAMEAKEGAEPSLLAEAAVEAVARFFRVRVL